MFRFQGAGVSALTLAQSRRGIGFRADGLGVCRFGVQEG